MKHKGSWAGPALDRHIALIGFMGAGKSTVGVEVAARIGREFVDLDAEVERHVGISISEFFAQRGETDFRIAESVVTIEALRRPEPAVFALGGGAVQSEAVRETLRKEAFTALVEVDPEVAWSRVRGGDRPLAQSEEQFRALFEARQPLYRDCADAIARDTHEVVLGAGAVHVETGALASLAELVPGEGPIALVSDENVATTYGEQARSALAARVVSNHDLPAGEEAKTIASVETLWRALELDRQGTLVAIGGGSTTDAAGFVAATYLRGIPWVTVPTTLVGQVDAAIGGKTAINLPQGKNLVGAFHWPVQTVVDSSLLATLPERERRAGMAEVVKAGLLAGEPFWRLDDAELVRRSAAYKVELCLRDPHDRGTRVALNLGHTFAHALEAASDYELAHGDAVALGLLAALRLSGLPTDDVEEILAPKPVRVDRERAWQALGRDKKAAGGRPRLVLLERPGHPIVDAELPDEQVRQALDSLIAS